MSKYALESVFLIAKNGKVCGVNWEVIPHINCPTTKEVRITELEHRPMFGFNHSVNSSSHSVNGDIAIQWEWSNFDHSWNPNRLTDYDKTLHN